jgi:hypothetical protein
MLIFLKKNLKIFYLPLDEQQKADRWLKFIVEITIFLNGIHVLTHKDTTN